MKFFSGTLGHLIGLPLFCVTMSSIAQAESISDGSISRIVGVNANLCLGVKDSSNDSGAILQSQTCSGSDYQSWKMTKDAANYFQIINQGSGKCIDLTGGSTSTGTILQQWGCSSGADYQKWNISDQGGGEFAIISKYSDLAMDVSGASKNDGANIIQWTWTGGDNQKWVFPEATTSGLDGSVFSLVNVKANKCLSVKNDSNDTGAIMVSNSCTGSAYQSWALQADSSGHYALVNQGSGQCMDIPGGSSDAGVIMQQWNCSGGDWQKWILTEQSTGQYTIKSVYTNQVLDVWGGSTSDGASIIQWTEKTSNNSNQLWTLSAGQASSSNDIPGFGAGVTGGAGGEVVTVTTPAQLTAAVADNNARIIRVSGIIDYRTTEGTTTEPGCTYSDNYCSYNGKQEKILDFSSYCSGRTLYNITYDTAGKTPLDIGSNKTLIGVGANSGIKGKGIRMSGGVSNIIVRNLSITDINDGTIWAGDALTIDNASNIWIDHNYIARIGRQFIVTGWGTAQNVTISGNYLDGTTDYGHYCNQRHYWTALLVAENQSITMVGNRFSMTSGRAPKFGKQDTANSAGILHMVNNYYDQNYYLGLASDYAGAVLMEGNYFEQSDEFFVPISSDSSGTPLYAPLDLTISSTTSTCQSVLGRDCVSNYDTNAPSNFVINASAMSAIQSNSTWLNAVKSVTPLSYSEVKAQSFGPQADITY